MTTQLCISFPFVPLKHCRLWFQLDHLYHSIYLFTRMHGQLRSVWFTFNQVNRCGRLGMKNTQYLTCKHELESKQNDLRTWVRFPRGSPPLLFKNLIFFFKLVLIAQQVQQANVDDEEIARAINSKLGETLGISYSEIASKAVDCGRTHLAIKVREHCTNIHFLSSNGQT